MALSKNAKIALWGCGSLLFVGIAIVVVVVVLVAANKDKIVEGGKQGIEEGEAFGKAHAQNDCVTEAVRRNAACSGVFCEAGVNIFVNACLNAAAPEAATCAGVPEPTEIFKAVAWEKDRCTEAGRKGSEPCRRLMQAVLTYCNQKGRAAAE